MNDTGCLAIEGEVGEDSNILSAEEDVEVIGRNYIMCRQQGVTFMK